MTFDDNGDNYYRPASYMERLNYAEMAQWEVVEVKNEGKAPMMTMQMGVGMINARDMLIFGGMAAGENGENGDAISDAFFFDVDSNTFVEAASLRDEERF